MGTVEITMLLHLVVYPLAAALAGYLLAILLKRSLPGSALVLSLGVAIGLGLADWFLRGSTDWWPVDVTRRLPYLTLLAVPVAWAEAIYRSTKSRWLPFVTILLRGAVSVFLAWQLTSVAEPRWLWIAGITVALTTVWTLLALRVPDTFSWLGLGSWALVAGLGGGILALAGAASLGLVCASIGIMLGILSLLHLRWPSFGWQSIAGVMLVPFFGLVISSQQFAELPLYSGVLLLIAPLAGLLVHVKQLQSKRWILLSMVIAPILLLTGSAGWLAKPVAKEEVPASTSNPYQDYYKK